MDNNLLTTCEAVFLDPGGSNNYNDDLDFTKTIMPISGGQFITADFQAFELEDETNCNYDYLTIHNGPDAFAPIIGSYCGLNSPGIVTSTDNSGALTFVFHSDQGVTKSGWEAAITCSGPVGINNTDLANVVEVYPNPTTGMISIRLKSKIEGVITITDILGKAITQVMLKDSEKHTIDLSGNAKGTYFLKFRSESGTNTQRIIINN
ncbi:MAG: T9SS type A sorting domain-containing protein [Bacteroidetes bacterium]|nr:T9SS type A sorting domain-containing protein [Bacteroidota bacterium]